MYTTCKQQNNNGKTMKVNQKFIKAEITKFLTQNKISAGIMNGSIKKIIVQIEENNQWQGAEGKVAIFYKNCKSFTNHENQQTERPCEIFTFELEYTNDEDEDQKIREFDFSMFESDFFDSIGSEWQEKKEERQSDSEFIEFWM